jgi:acyl carrier protein
MGESGGKMTKEELYSKIKEIVSTEFEVDAGTIKPESRLVEELGLDSIDAVDLLVQFKPYLSGNIEPSQFKDAHTIQDVVNILYPLLKK